MTPQEAIEFLNRTKAGCNILRDKQLLDVCNIAISAIEKQIPKKPLKEYGGAYRCPNCQMKHFNPEWVGTKCCDCGQVLDWD